MAHVPFMVDTSFFAALVTPSGLISLIALVIAAVSFAGYLTGLREASLRKRQLVVISQAVEQLSRLSVLEFGGIERLSRSLADALNPTGEPTLQSPEAKAAYQVLGPEPDRFLEEVEAVLTNASNALGWRYSPGSRAK